MKIILKDFNYKGHHIENCEFDFPQLKDYDEALSDRCMIYIEDTLDDFIKEES